MKGQNRKRPPSQSPSLVFPDEVRLCKSSIPGASLGVYAARPIPPGTWIGPYEGQVVRSNEIRGEMDTRYMWEVRP